MDQWHHSLSPATLLLKLGLIDKLLLKHVGLPHVLDLTVHLVNLQGWMGKGDHFRYLATLLLKVRVD